MAGEKMNYKIKNIVALCTPGSNIHNEDVCGFKDNIAWVIDGATGLNGRNFMPDITDARWYSSWWDKYLRKNITDNISIDLLMKRGIREVKEEFEMNLVNNFKIEFKELSKLDYPSASIALIRLNGDYLEYIILGDCRIYTDDLNFPKIADETISKFDKDVFDAMRKLNDFGYIDYSEIKNKVMDKIIENRLKNNTENGYWILSFDEKAIDNAVKGKIKISEHRKILMASDGYYAMCDKYNLFDEKDILDLSFYRGAVSMFEILRRFENDDDKVRFIPRFKKMDDCTCLMFEIEGVGEY